MLIIAGNLTTRDSNVEYLFGQARAAGWSLDSAPANTLRDKAKQCAAAGADIIEINTQQHHDSPEAMQFAVRAIQQVTDRQLCLSSNNPAAIEAGLKACKKPPLVNHVSVEESGLKTVLPVVAKNKGSIVLLVSAPAAPKDAREMLQTAAILTGAAGETGITPDRIFIDPGLIHVSSEIGQRHLVEVAEFLRNLPEAMDPPAKTVCFLHNGSSGAPARLRYVIETALLPFLAGAGLSAVFLDVTNREVMRTVRLLQIFEDKRVYSDSEIDL
jgi:cobalamin-dependent methionine synthase I